MRKDFQGVYKPFRFEVAWLSHSGFREFIETNWGNGQPLEEALRDFVDKLRAWNKDVFGDVRRFKDRLRRRLKGVQTRIIHQPSQSCWSWSVNWNNGGRRWSCRRSWCGSRSLEFYGSNMEIGTQRFSNLSMQRHQMLMLKINFSIFLLLHQSPIMTKQALLWDMKTLDPILTSICGIVSCQIYWNCLGDMVKVVLRSKKRKVMVQIDKVKSPSIDFFTTSHFNVCWGA